MKNGKHEAPRLLKPLTGIEVAPAEVPAKAADKLTLTLGTPEAPSTLVKDYNHAAAQEKAWKKVKEEKKPGLEQAALDYLYAHNVENPTEAAKTVCVVDGSKSACNVTLKDTYENVAHDPDVVTKALWALGINDVNTLVAEKLVIGFDTTVFYDEKGALRKQFYTDMLAAIREVADQHGIPSPMSSHKVVNVKPGFGDKRWTLFSEGQQARVTEVFKPTISAMPVAPAKTAK